MIIEAGQRPVQYICKPHIEATQLDDEWMLLNLEQYTITKINGTGGFLWSLLHEEQTIETLFDAFVAEYRPSSSLDVMKQNIEDFLAKLKECGLVENVCD